jgi:transcription initiation factor TFIIIB Brf1 subunit/transcription initiation factor TFIIB
MKFELRHCTKGCGCMTNHFVKDNGDVVCLKCGYVTFVKKSKLPPGWEKLFGE